MIEILPRSTETRVGFKVSSKLSADEYYVLLPKMDEAIAAHDKINLLMVKDDLEGYEGLDAAKADFKFGTHQYH